MTTDQRIYLLRQAGSFLPLGKLPKEEEKKSPRYVMFSPRTLSSPRFSPRPTGTPRMTNSAGESPRTRNSPLIFDNLHPKFSVKDGVITLKPKGVHSRQDSIDSQVSSDSFEDISEIDYVFMQERRLSLDETKMGKMVSESEMKRKVTEVRMVYSGQMDELREELDRLEYLLKVERSKTQNLKAQLEEAETWKHKAEQLENMNKELNISSAGPQ